MKNKSQVKKAVSIVLKLLITFTFLYCLIAFVVTGKQNINVETVSTFYGGSNLNATISVSDKKTKADMKSSLKVELLNSDNKKVKNVKEKCKIDKGEKADISLELPENLETGKYTLKVISKSGILRSVAKVPVAIIKGKESKIIISLDKGIYKPGDEINFRALLISEKDNTPVNADEVKVTIFDGNDNRVYSETSKTSEYGIISGMFKLADTVNSGNYKIIVSTTNQELTKNFIVNPYVAPKFETSISTDKENYIVGDKAQITFNAKYFFGEPVANASITGKINEEEFTGLTDANGNFVKEVEIKKVGQTSITAQVEDTSKYFVEASKTIIAGTDIFEVEIIPEYVNLISGIENNVYVITKTADNKPIKTYVTAKVGTISREVITDENGVGKFTLTSSDIDKIKSDNKYKTQISVVSENMDGNKVSKTHDLKIRENSGTIVKTDKVKYQENENINLSLISSTDLINKNIYIFKGNELLKTISYEGDSINFSLDGISGLVDIYYGSNTSSGYEYNSYVSYKDTYDSRRYNYNQKTIFIIPNKKLSIDIQTDKDTYLPKENLNLKFTTQDENNNVVDSALLVSILDEAILSLAENDLSIDNLKVALEDIKLSEGVTAADVYASVLEESNQGLLEELLLEQNTSRTNKVTSINYSTSEEETLIYVILGSIAFVCELVIVLNILKRKKPKLFKKIVNFFYALVVIAVIFAILQISFVEWIEDAFWRFDNYEVISTITVLILSIILYNLILYKEKNYILRNIYELLILPVIIAVIIVIIKSIFEIFEFNGLLELILIVCLIVALIFGKKGKKATKLKKQLKKLAKILGKAFLFWFAMAAILEISESSMWFLIVILAYVFLEKIVFQKTETKMEDGKIVLNVTGNEFVGIFVGFVFILIIVSMVNSLTKNFSSNITMEDRGGLEGDIVWSEPKGGVTFSDSDIKIDTMDQAQEFTYSGKSISNFAENTLLDKIVSQSIENSDNKVQDNLEVNVEKQTEVEENIRNVFLESLAFIPEVITENGKASLDLKISDNITTWNIQAVGNTKAGNIGFSNKQFKVFKEFFVDFSLPTNAVNTDKVSIPVTVYNYTENALPVKVEVKPNDWSNIGEYTKEVNVPANSTQMVYVPIEILKTGDNTLRIESTSGNISDIVEKTMKVNTNGLKKESVISSGSTDGKIEQDILFTDKGVIPGTERLRVKLYPSAMAQIIEGIDSMLEMPTGCFEQTSSSLYPDILVLEYLEDNNIINDELKSKALSYINAGYQRLLTYEVKGSKGGYSLYGRRPAETVITAFGLMEMKELSNVYDVDENVIQNMTEFLFKEQKIDGSFNYDSTYIGGASSTTDIAMNSYIIWALSEACPEDARLDKSIKYLEKNLDKVKDTYTLALMANAFSNTKNSNTKDTIDRLMKEVKTEDNQTSYVSSKTVDYYGCYGRGQSIQATALTSLVLSKEGKNTKTNATLVNYLLKQKDSHGNWYNTQSTILALKAINEFNRKTSVEEQTITVSLNGEKTEIKIDKNTLSKYDLVFDNFQKENKVSIDFKKGNISYEIIKEYYEDYNQVSQDLIANETNGIKVTQSLNQELKVNEIINQNIRLVNSSDRRIVNGIVRINIPQGASVIEESLAKLEHEEKIEKYEYNYGTIDLYLRNYEKGDILELNIQYRANYPEEITGAAIRVYDYYNPEIEGLCVPVQIKVK